MRQHTEFSGRPEHCRPRSLGKGSQTTPWHCARVHPGYRCPWPLAPGLRRLWHWWPLERCPHHHFCRRIDSFGTYFLMLPFFQPKFSLELIVKASPTLSLQEKLKNRWGHQPWRDRSHNMGNSTYIGQLLRRYPATIKMTNAHRGNLTETLASFGKTE